MVWNTRVLPRRIVAGEIWSRKVDAARIRRIGAAKTEIRPRKFRCRSRRWREDLCAFVSDAGCKTTLGPPEAGEWSGGMEWGSGVGECWSEGSGVE